MKKLYLFFIVIVSILTLAFISNPQVKADGEPTVSTIDGASIRITDPAGLRFSAHVEGSFTGTEVHYGFLLSKGEFTASQMQTLYEHDYASAVDAGELDASNNFYVSIVNIPGEGYDTDLTALAYVDVDGVKTYATNVCTRNIEEVAVANSTELGDEAPEFVKKIVNSSNLVLDGGSLEPEDEITVIKDGTAGEYAFGSGYDITIGNKTNANRSCGLYWSRIFIKSVPNGLYKVVGISKSGESNYTGEYDYIIAASGGCTDTEGAQIIKSIVKSSNYENYYLKLSTLPTGALDCNINVSISTDPNRLTGGRIVLSDGTELPDAVKDYYTFDGWYSNNEFSGEKIINHTTGSQTYYAKYIPIEYTITYELQGGTCSSMLTTTYNIETNAFNLPTETSMTIADGSFAGWYDNDKGTGSPITSIKKGSHGDITLYAVWIMDTPTELSISTIDKNIIETVTPTKYVNTTFETGKYSINGNVYKFGEGELFIDITSAINAAVDNDVIYIFGGNYADQEFTITKNNLSLIGPNYNVSAKGSSPTRNTEAVIKGTSTIICNGTNTIFNGLKLSGKSYISISSSATNLSILNMYSDSTGMSASISANGNRTGVIYSPKPGCTGVTIKNSYFNIGASTYCKNPILLYGTAKNITIEDNYITNSATSPSTSEAIQFGTAAGTISIQRNDIIYPTSNCVLYMSSGSANINIINNSISGKSSSNYSATIRIVYGSSTGSINVIGNNFTYLNTNTFNLLGTAAGHKLNIYYNYFNGKTFQITNLGSGTINYLSNYYTVAQTTSTSDYGVITSLTDLITAYKASDEYATYGNVCVYEN